MAGAGKKTFTAGEVLTASDTNQYLMEQTVMYFAGTAARASAIPTPTTGMTSYIGVTGTASIPQIETYTGSAWQTPYGSTLVANVTLTAASSVNIENCFSAAYDNYLIFYNITSTTGTPNSLFQLRNSGGNLTTGYNSNLMYVFGGSVSGATRGTNNWFSFAQSAGDISMITLSRPFLTLGKSWLCTATQGTAVGTEGGQNGSTTSYPSLAFTSSGTITGTIKIYGLRNS